MPPSPKQNITVRLPPETRGKLTALARKYDVPDSQILRWALKAILDLDKACGGITLPLNLSPFVAGAKPGLPAQAGNPAPPDAPPSLWRVGDIAAGEPAATGRRYPGIPVSTPKRYPDGYYILRVIGKGMEKPDGTGIPHLADVIVRPAETAESGDAVIALADGQAILKRYANGGTRARLLNDNPDFPGIIPGEDASIQGVVIGHIHQPITGS